jgi:uracil-DNA glycosylase family 4
MGNNGDVHDCWSAILNVRIHRADSTQLENRPTSPAPPAAIPIVGEAPASDGWWTSSRAFYRRTATGGLILSKSGVNVNPCLAVLGTAIDAAGFVEAVRYWPDEPGPWRPPKRVRRHCLPFLDQHLRITRPRLILPIGLVASASCFEVAFAQTPATLEAVVGKAREWSAPWGSCWIVPLYHPSPANGARWRRNTLYLRRLVTHCPRWAGRLVEG